MEKIDLFKKKKFSIEAEPFSEEENEVDDTPVCDIFELNKILDERLAGQDFGSGTMKPIPSYWKKSKA